MPVTERVPEIVHALERIDAERIRRTVFHLSSCPLPFRKLNATLPGHERSTLAEADAFLRLELERAGYGVAEEKVRVQAYRRDRTKPPHAQYSRPAPEDPWYEARNLYAEKKGDTHPEEILLVLSHKDSQSWIDSPGANDNAVGTACTLELARVVRQLATRRTLRFLLCNEEHTPWTSVAAAGNARARGDRLVAIFNLDALGRKSDADTAAGRMRHVTLYTAPEGERIADLVACVAAAYGLGLETEKLRRARPGDDDGSFVKAGYPAAVCCIGSYPYADPNYHLESDRAETVDVANATLSTKAVLAALLTLDRSAAP